MLRLQFLGHPETCLGERYVQGFVHIVDDDALFRRAMERRLKHACYEVASYASAQQLLDHLPSESVPSCILLDVQLPELSGPELQTRLSAWLDPANHIPHRSSRHPDHGAGHQVGCR